jgi:hypothetical protein
VTTQGLILVLALGAGVIAMWVDFRFEGWTPEGVLTILAHAAAAFAALQVLPIILHHTVQDSGSPALKLFSVFVGVLPVLTYLWLSSIWLLKLVQRGVGLR